MAREEKRFLRDFLRTRKQIRSLCALILAAVLAGCTAAEKAKKVPPPGDFDQLIQKLTAVNEGIENMFGGGGLTAVYDTVRDITTTLEGYLSNAENAIRTIDNEGLQDSRSYEYENLGSRHLEKAQIELKKLQQLVGKLPKGYGKEYSNKLINFRGVLEVLTAEMTLLSATNTARFIVRLAASSAADGSLNSKLIQAFNTRLEEVKQQVKESRLGKGRALKKHGRAFSDALAEYDTIIAEAGF